MGRGRAKAKQTKVARKLKYSTGNTDLSQLAEELGASSGPTVRESDHRDGSDDHDDLVDRYSDYEAPPPAR